MSPTSHIYEQILLWRFCFTHTRGAACEHIRSVDAYSAVQRTSGRESGGSLSRPGVFHHATG